MLAVDTLTPAQAWALLRGVEVFTEQVSAMQLQGALAEQAVGIAQPIGTIFSVGDELRRHVAEPLAADLRGVQGALTPALVQAAIDALSPVAAVAIRDPGDGTLWFDVDLAGGRELIDFALDVGQRPSEIPGQRTLYDQGLRLAPLEVDVTAGYAGRVSFGIDRNASLTAEQAVVIDVDSLRVFARASHTGATALADLDASFGSLRLGPADVDVDFDVAAAIDLVGGVKRLGELLGVPAAESFSVLPAVDSRFQVSIPFTLGVGGFTDTGTELRVGIGATGFFHEASDVAPLGLSLLKDADPGPAKNWQPGSLSPVEGGSFTAPGEFGLAPFGGVSATDLGSYLVELERIAPSLLAGLEVPLVGRTAGELFDIGSRVSDFVAGLRTPEGEFRFETADDLVDELARFFQARDGSPRNRSAFDLKWSMAAQGLQFRVPLEFLADTSLVFDAGTFRGALPAVVPIDVTGRGTAALELDATTLALVGGVTSRDAAGLPDRRVTLDTSVADALRDLDLPDLLPGAAEFSFDLRDGTRIDVNLDAVLPAWRRDGARMRDVTQFFNGVAPGRLSVDLVDGALRFTDLTTGGNLFKVIFGEEQSVVESAVGGDPLTTTRLSLAALAFGLAVAPSAGDVLEGVSLEFSALRDRLYFKPQAEGQVTITLDADVAAAISMGTLAVGTHPLDAGAAAIRSVVGVVPSLGTAVAAADGRITLAELEDAGAAAVNLAVAPVSQAGVLQFDVPAALVGDLGIDVAAYRSAPLEDLAAVMAATATVPYLSLAPLAAGSTWSFDVLPSEKLAELATGLGDVSLADLEGMLGELVAQLGRIGFWNVKLPGIDASLGDLFPVVDALDCLGGFDVAALGVPTIQNGTVTWPTESFGGRATGFLQSLADAGTGFANGSDAVKAAGMRLESLSWELEALLVEIPNHAPGDPAADLDLLQRIRNLSVATGAEVAALPVDFGSLKASFQELPTFLDGLKFNLESFADRLAAALTCGLTLAAGGGGGTGGGGTGGGSTGGGGTGGGAPPSVPRVTVVPLRGSGNGGGVAGPTGRLLFGLEIDFAGVKRAFDFSSLDLSVGGASLPFTVEGTGQLQFAFGGTFTTQIGWDFATDAPILVAAETRADLTASIESVNQTGFTLTASLGGLADISVGTTQTPATIRLTAAADAAPGTPASFSLAGGGAPEVHAFFEAVLPLFASSIVADGPLGTATLTATFEQPAPPPAAPPGQQTPPTFDVSADFNPDDIDIEALFADLSFNPDLWKELICGFMTDLTNDLVAKALGALPLVGDVDFSGVSFFTDVCGWLRGRDFASFRALRESLIPGSSNPQPPDTTITTLGPVSERVGAPGADPDGPTGPIDPANPATWTDWGPLGLRDRVIIPITVNGTRSIAVAEGGIDVGLSGLGITVGGAATLDLRFTLDIGLGFSRLEGFFIQTRGTS
ncbi:MAG: hypothetical protein ACKOCX_12435, partial [Planctomycetota bacterium]